jgi:CBS domain-containing protein
MDRTQTTGRLTRTLVTGQVVYVRDDDSVERAAERLAREDVGALPVCDHNDRLTGVITDRDIVTGVVAQRKDPANTPVGDVAHARPVTVGADEPIERAMQLMAEHKIRRLPVMDAEYCIGLISQADIARAMPPELTGKLVELISTD